MVKKKQARGPQKPAGCNPKTPKTVHRPSLAAAATAAVRSDLEREVTDLQDTVTAASSPLPATSPLVVASSSAPPEVSEPEGSDSDDEYEAEVEDDVSVHVMGRPLPNRSRHPHPTNKSKVHFYYSAKVCACCHLIPLPLLIL